MKLHLYLILAISCVILTTYTNAHPGDLVEPIDTPFEEDYGKSRKLLDFIVVGDWGYEKTQHIVADDMRKWAEKNRSDFVVNVGDNFYISKPGDYDGVLVVNDPKWESDWNQVYTGRLAVIPWFSVAGNHDWYGNVTAQVDYSKNHDHRFFLPSTNYVRVSYFGPRKTKVVWIHIDTNILYYNLNSDKFQGANVKPSYVSMKTQLDQFGWDSEQVIEDRLKWIADRLIEQQDAKWIFVVGHQPLVGKCAKKYYMKFLRPMFEKYRVTAYFSGHRHTLELEKAQPGQPVTYFLSGAGSQTETPGCIKEKKNKKDWGVGGILGFLHCTLNENEMSYQYIDSTNGSKIIYEGKVTPRT